MDKIYDLGRENAGNPFTQHLWNFRYSASIRKTKPNTGFLEEIHCLQMSQNHQTSEYFFKNDSTSEALSTYTHYMSLPSLGAVS